MYHLRLHWMHSASIPFNASSLARIVPSSSFTTGRLSISDCPADALSATSDLA